MNHNLACSVVIPMYNRKHTIARALDSVLAQTRGDFEVIVVDDGSTDGCGDVVRRCRDRRVRLLRQENAGHCAARNTALAQVRAPWIAFLDSDDEWLPQFLEKTIGFAEIHPDVSGVFTNILSVRDDEAWLRFPGSDARVLDNYFGFATKHWGRGMTCSSSVARTAALKRIGGFPAGVLRSGDCAAWLRLALTGPIGFIPQVLAAYHNEHPGITLVVPDPVYPEGVKAARSLRAQGLIPEEHDRYLSRLEAMYLLLHARDLIDVGARDRARRVLFGDCRWRDCPPVPLAKAVLRSLGV